jgi:fatty acid kinase fatty acid binding subunit
MSRIAFVTDTTCNLPDPIIQSQHIAIVPVYVIFGDQSYKDYVELQPVEFYRRLIEYKAAGKGMPTTSQPTPEDFRVCYAGLAQQGYTDIISIHVTAKSSGTCHSAELAGTMVEGVNVHVVDSTSTSMHMSFMLFEAIEAVTHGGGVTEALDAIERVKGHSCMHFTVTDLEHLTSSGRTEDHARATEAPISVKPIIAISEGVPKAVGVERTQHLALDKVLNLTRAQIGAAKPLRLAIVNGNIPQKASQWAEEVCARLGYEGEPYIVDFGPALAVHFGPGLLGITVQWG